MPTKTNAASKVVQAKPCPKTADIEALPTMRQMMLLALEIVGNSLEAVALASRVDEAWNEDDVDVDYAVDLALTYVKSLRANLPEDINEFGRQWYMAASAINLSVRAFSRTDCYYYRSLVDAKKNFEVLVSVVEFAEKRA